jgi:hypothetical protein
MSEAQPLFQTESERQLALVCHSLGYKGAMKMLALKEKASCFHLIGVDSLCAIGLG